MPHGQYVEPNNSSRLIISTSNSIPHPQRITIWRTDIPGNTIQGPFTYDASSPNKKIQELNFPPAANGYNVNFKFERLINNNWVEYGLQVVPKSDGVSFHYKYYNESIILDLRWSEDALNNIRLAMIRLDNRRISDPSHDLKDEVYCDMKAEYPENPIIPTKRKRINIGSFGNGEHIFPGDGKILYEGAIQDAVKISIDFYDTDDLSPNDLTGSFEVSASRYQPLAQYKKIRYCTIESTNVEGTYSECKLRINGDGADYSIYLRADSSRRPVNFLAKVKNPFGIKTTSLIVLVSAGIVGGLLTKLLSSKDTEK